MQLKVFYHSSLLQLFNISSEHFLGAELKFWNLAFRSCLWSVKAHQGFVRGVVGAPDGHHILSCGDDKTVKLWSVEPQYDSEDEANQLVRPLRTYLGKHAFTYVIS